MYYAHTGNSTDNGFNDDRSFYAFKTKEERQFFQDKVWADSGKEQNVIFCTAQFVKNMLETSKPYSVGSGSHLFANRVFSSYEAYEYYLSQYADSLTEN